METVFIGKVAAPREGVAIAFFAYCETGSAIINVDKLERSLFTSTRWRR